MPKPLQKLTGIPSKITPCMLECLVMPNGEILSNGHKVGWLSSYLPFMYIKPIDKRKESKDVKHK